MPTITRKITSARPNMARRLRLKRRQASWRNDRGGRTSTRRSTMTSTDWTADSASSEGKRGRRSLVMVSSFPPSCVGGLVEADPGIEPGVADVDDHVGHPVDEHDDEGQADEHGQVAPV